MPWLARRLLDIPPMAAPRRFAGRRALLLLGAVILGELVTRGLLATAGALPPLAASILDPLAWYIGRMFLLALVAAATSR
jgi:hypothetical protein